MRIEPNPDSNRLKIFLVDDDVLYLKSSEIEFKRYTNCTVETYASGELCMEHLSQNPDVIILDYRLDNNNKNAMNGIEILDKIKRFNSDIAVVILSAQDNIDVAVACMHHRAFDYVVKSKTAFRHLEKIITNIKQVNLV